MTNQKIPVIDSVDVAIVEGTVAGCALAYYLAKRGLRVALLSSGTSPAHEVSTCLRPFCHGDEIDAMPSVFARIFDSAMTREVFETSFIHVGRVTDGIEDLLLDQRINVLYTAYPAGALFAEGRIAGVVVGGKFGLQAILAPVVVDCSPWGSTAKMAGANFAGRSDSGKLGVSYSFLCKDDLPALEHYKISGDVVSDAEVVTRGFYAELIRQIEFDIDDPLTVAKTSTQLRHDLLAIGRWKRETLPELDIVRGADAFLPAPFLRLESAAGRQAKSAGSVAAAGVAGATSADVGRLHAADVPNLYVLSQCADLDDKDASGLHRVYHKAIYQAAELARVLVAGSHPDPAEFGYEVRTCTGVPGDDAGETQGVALSVGDPGYEESGTTEISVLLPSFPHVSHSDVLVVGAGSSGSPAAAAAASAGASVTCIDKHGDVGGTHTIGGVTTPWFGHRPPYFQRLQKRLRATKREASVPQALALTDWLAEQGVTLLSSLPVAGAYHTDTRVTAVLGLGPYGPVMISAGTVVDATGDGDIAAWAGAPYTYGTERDNATQWCSFGKFTDKRPSVSRKYRSIIDVRSLRDISRGMTIGRRQIGMFGEAEYPQYYLTPRESRHIAGRARLTFLDGLGERRFADTVAVHFSNFDIKGIASSDLVMIGFMDHEKYRCYETYIPYGTMVPEKLENVLVTGKAYNASHDVLGLARQVADVMCQGAAAGVAAAMAAQDGGSVDGLDVPALQKRLVEEGLIAEPDFMVQEPDAKQSLEAYLSTGDFKHIGRLALAGGCAVDAIKARIGETEGDIQRNLSRLLCHFADTSAVDLLLDDLRDELEGDLLPAEVSDLKNVPNHGYEPEASYSINALALVDEKRLIPILATLPGRIHLPCEETDAQFCYVHSISYAAERMTDSEFVPILEELLENPQIGGGTLATDDDPRKTVDWVADRYAYLEVCVARALARCGGARGYAVLIGYLSDMRSFLANTALAELNEITGQERCFDQAAWSAWLEQNKSNLERKPMKRRFD